MRNAGDCDGRRREQSGRDSRDLRVGDEVYEKPRVDSHAVHRDVGRYWIDQARVAPAQNIVALVVVTLTAAAGWLAFRRRD